MRIQNNINICNKNIYIGIPLFLTICNAIIISQPRNINLLKQIYSILAGFQNSSTKQTPAADIVTTVHPSLYLQTPHNSNDVCSSSLPLVKKKNCLPNIYIGESSKRNPTFLLLVPRKVTFYL